jgi:hypothetical protein
MKVLELMERVGIKETGRALAYIKDGLEEINIIHDTNVDVQRINIAKDQRFYELPYDLIKVLSIRAKNHLNTKDEYRKIPRMIYEPIIEDADEV